MKVLVTGATGFVGAHVTRALLARGAEVRCLVRPARTLGPPRRWAPARHGAQSSAVASPPDNLAGLAVERFPGDLRDPGSLRRAVDGCDILYHVAADYRLFTRDPKAMYAANVDGTDSLLASAAEAGVRRVVYTSSVGALGLNADGSPADERTPVALGDMVGHYKRSKYLAERAAERWVERGLAVVVVNPSTPVGDLDVKPTPTGQMIVDFLCRRFPAYVDTGLNLIDVRDVAEGHLLAAERGVPGERYILGHLNMSLIEILQALSRMTGLPAPRVRVPHWLPLAAAYVGGGVSRLTGGTPRVTPEAVRMSRHRMFFDAGKAVRDLGLPQSPIEDALGRAARWFVEQGYAPPARRTA